MALDELEGKLLAGLLAPYGDEPTPTQEQIAKALAAQRITQLRKLVDAETKRRTAEQLGRDHIQMYGIPQLSENVEFLRASGEQLRQMQRVVAPLARTLATRLAARRRRSRAGAIDLRKTLRKSMYAGRVPIDVVLAKPRPARPELVVLCDVSGSVAGFSHFTLLLVHALRQQFSRVRVFAFIDTTDEVARRVSGRRPTGRGGTRPGSPGRPACTAATGIPTTATRLPRSSRRIPTCCRHAARCWCSGMAAPTTVIRRQSCWPTW